MSFIEKGLIAALISIAVIACAVVWPSEAFAQQTVCGDRAKIVKKLSEGYGERPVVIAQSARSGGVFELWASEDGSTWSAFITSPHGIACFIDAGQAFDLLPTLPADNGPPL